MHRYSHTQVGWLTLSVLVMFALGVPAAAVAVGGVDPTGWAAISVFSFVLFVVAGLFGTLTVTVTDRAVEARFGVFPLIRRTIQLDAITATEEVRNRWWYGWGVRLTPHGWLWNVGGLDAVELRLDSKRGFRIGTDEPGALRAALESVRAEFHEIPAQ